MPSCPELTTFLPISGCFFAHYLLKKSAGLFWNENYANLEWLNLSRNFFGHNASQLQYCHSEASPMRLKFAKKYKMLWTSEMFYNIIVRKASQHPPNLLWLDREQSLKNSMRYSSWKYCYQKLNILGSRQWRDTPTLLQWGPDSANWTAGRTEHFNFKINFWYSLKRI